MSNPTTTPAAFLVLNGLNGQTQIWCNDCREVIESVDPGVNQYDPITPAKGLVCRCCADVTVLTVWDGSVWVSQDHWVAVDRDDVEVEPTINQWLAAALDTNKVGVLSDLSPFYLRVL